MGHSFAYRQRKGTTMKPGSLRVFFIATAWLLLLLSGCTTPATMLRHPTTGQVVSCGGNTVSSVAGGYVGYSIQKSADERCVAQYVEQGFKPTR
jgi:hypothetical protein